MVKVLHRPKVDVRRKPLGYAALSLSANVPLTGVAGTGGAGTCTAEVDSLLVGIAGTGNVGSFLLEVDVTIVNVSATGHVGFIVEEGSVSTELASVTAIGGAGILSSDIEITIDGAEVIGSAGIAVPEVDATLVGLYGTGLVGDFVPEVDVILDSVFATGFAGNILVDRISTFIGVEAAGNAGTITTFSVYTGLPVDTFPAGDFICVNFSSSQDVAFAIKENQFTAGYTQKAQDGIHNVRDTWNVEFSELSPVDMLTVYNFLRGKKGYISFFWTPPRETTPRRWTCTKLQRTPVTFSSWKINAVFQEQFIYKFTWSPASSLIGVQGVGHAGTITADRISATIDQPLLGVQGIGQVASLNNFNTDISAYGGNFFVMTRDGDNLYVAEINGDFSGIIVKLDTDLNVVSTFDIKATIGSPYTPYPDVGGLVSDGTYLYAFLNSGVAYVPVILRILLSDFTTYSTKSTAPLTSGSIAELFIHGGYLYMLDGFRPLVRLLLSDFDTLSSLDPSAVNSSLENWNFTFVQYDHYIIALNFDGFGARFDLDNFTFGGITAIDLSSTGSNKYYFTGRGSSDGTWVYFGNAAEPLVLRIKIVDLSLEVLDLSTRNPDYDGFPGGTLINGNDLWVFGFRGDTGPAARIDVSSAALMSDMTVQDIYLSSVASLPSDNIGDVLYYNGFAYLCMKSNVARFDLAENFEYPLGSLLYNYFDNEYGDTSGLYGGTSLPSGVDTFSGVPLLHSGYSPSSVRRVVVAVSAKMTGAAAGQSFASVTVAGIAATKIIEQASPTGRCLVALYSVYMPTGTTGDIIVQASASMDVVQLNVYDVLYANNGGVPAFTQYGYGNGTIASNDINFPLPATSFGIAVFALDGALDAYGEGVPSLSGGGEFYDGEGANNMGAISGLATGPQTISYDWGLTPLGAVDWVMVSATWG